MGVRLICVAVLVLATLPGCGASDRAETVPVTGTVTYNGAPLEHGTVIFYPADGRPAYGKIAKGSLTDVTTYEPADGAVPGAHRVVVQSTDKAADADPMAAGKSLIPERYGDPEKSGLTAEIEPGKANEITLELKD